MAGMITTGTTGTSEYSNRTVEIEVTGVARQNVSRLATYTIKVPYSRMFQTMQSIYNLGGTVVNVTLPAHTPAAVKAERLRG